MDCKVWFGFAVVLGMSACADVAQQSAEVRGGRFDPCATVRCAAGTHCQSRGRRAECVPDEPAHADDGGTLLSCASVLCITGTTCVETPRGPECVPAEASCQVDSDCRKEDNYCGGCHCLALADGESAPTCSDPVACFAAPCAVTAGEPACVNGSCVLQ